MADPVRVVEKERETESGGIWVMMGEEKTSSALILVSADC